MKDPACRRLLQRLGQAEAVAVAFSGGVDSAFVLATAQRLLGSRVLALAAVMPYLVR